MVFGTAILISLLNETTACERHEMHRHALTRVKYRPGNVYRVLVGLANQSDSCSDVNAHRQREI